MLRDDALAVVPEGSRGFKKCFAIIIRSFEILSVIIRRAHISETLYQCFFAVYRSVIVFVASE